MTHQQLLGCCQDTNQLWQQQLQVALLAAVQVLDLPAELAALKQLRHPLS